MSENGSQLDTEKSQLTIVNKHSILNILQQTSAGVKNRRALALEKEKLNLRYKGIQQQTDTDIKKKIEQVAWKTVRLAKKVKKPKTLEQKYKTTDGEKTDKHTTYSVGTNKREATEVFKK